MSNQQAGGSPLVERDGELARLDAALASARSGSGVTLVVEGAAGIGKTSLLARARERAATEEMVVLHARGTQLERDYPMGVVRQCFEPALRAAGDQGALFAGAARLARSVLLEVPDSTGAAPLGVLHGLYWLTANLAARRPVLLAVDDAHWSDEPSLRFLAHLARRVESLPAALMIATRTRHDSGAVAEVLAELRADAETVLVHPRPLAVAGVAAVLSDAGDGPVGEDFARACRDATGGNPFLLSELVRALRADEVPFIPESANRIAGSPPPTVARRVRVTLDRLGPAAGARARAVAVLGEDAELDLAAEVAGLEMGETPAVAASLADAGVLDDALPLRFLHPILAGAVRSDLSASERSAAHTRAAKLLRARGVGPERVALQLMHSTPAGDERVVSDLRLAAQRALARGAPATAASLLTRALAEPPPASARGELLLELGETEYAVGRTAAGAAHLEEAYRCAVAPLIRGRALVGLFQARAGNFRDQRAMAPLFEQTLPEVLEHNRELGLRLWTLKLIAVEPGPQWDLQAKGAESLGCDTPGEALLLGHATLPIVKRDVTAAELESVALRAAAHADALLEEGATALVMTGMVLGLSWTDRLDAAEELLGRAVVVARRRGAVADFALAHQFRAVVHRRAGRLREAEADARAALSAAAGAGWGGAGLGALWPLVGSLVAQGRVEDGAKELAAVHPHEEIPDAPAMIGLLLERMRLRAAQGEHRRALADWEEARRRAERYFRGINPSWVPDLLGAAEIQHALGDLEARDALLSESLTLAEHWGTPGAMGAARAQSARLAGSDDTISALTEAVELLRRSPARLELARALAFLGEARRRQDQRVESREPLREAYELARQCGANGLAERARAELRASGIRLRRESLSGSASLTPSERRIAEMAAGGATNAEIAQDLFLTIKTVEMHLTHAYRKLEIARRSELPAALAGKT